ncbi:hypothetical protein GCM10007160_39890 [Litchfieldella qijiaojingensis]|uniref:Uncharacterized protein n=1 Tax=Litchfieldella qijiaojingensis TaxID=980347 RepID=A0ABQ2Z8Q0_9GAMM|nr:hypothetical protein [Halomonas qijiaojingensis]GGY08552.1 hypothetical protein GCM10007160_39890 [Halomonas qijiaojingensis]
MAWSGAPRFTGEFGTDQALSDLTTILQYPELNDDALTTLSTLAFSEKQILATDGRWSTVRIMPYR